MLWNLRGIWNMDNFHFFKGIFVIFMWKWGGRMQRMMPWISYNFAKLLKKRNLGFNMHLQLIKKIGWSIFLVTYSLFWLVSKIWRCGFFCFTTYKVNAHDMPFGIFVGVNNHGKTILFGCALLRNETTSAFRWLMKVHSVL